MLTHRYLKNLSKHPGALLFAGVSATLAMPPLNLLPFYYFAIAVLFWALYCDVERLSVRRGFMLGWIFGFGQFGIGLYWIGNSFLQESESFLWLLPIAVIVVPGLVALAPGVACGLFAITMRWSALRVHPLASGLTLAVFLGLADYGRGYYLFSGFPWNIGAMAWGGILPLAQGVSLIGIYGLSMLVFMSTCAFAVLFCSRQMRLLAAIFAVVPLLFVGIYGGVRLTTVTSVTKIKLAIIQPNIEQDQKWLPEARSRIYEQMITMTIRARQQEPALNIIIWPEVALPFVIDETPDFAALIKTILTPDMLLLTGAVRRENGRWYNSIMGFNGDGMHIATTDKYQLVPFGEYLPFRPILEKIGLTVLTAQRHDYSAGVTAPRLMLGSFPTVAPLICYEAIFPINRFQTPRPHWLLNVTNDAWFGNTVGPYQHLAHARLRTIETGLPLIRAANTGISVSFDALGRIRAQKPLAHEGIIITNLPAPIAPNLYQIYGNLTFWGLVLFLISIILCLTLLPNISHNTRIKDVKS